jgi:hypothetical protein
LTDAAFLMLREAAGNVDGGPGRRLIAADLLAVAELVEAEYAAVRDVGGGMELFATPVGVEYLKMIDSLLGRIEDETT